MAILESVASSRRKVKENVKLDTLLPRQLREDAEMLSLLMESYYDFMNLFAYYYKEQDQTFYATVIDEGLIFRTEANKYFFDSELQYSKLYDANGNELAIEPIGTYIAGTDNLPDALADDLSTYGRLFFISTANLENYNFQQLRLVTPIIVYAGDSPSHTILNVLEQRDVDTIRTAFLEMLQKEIAASIPRNLQSDKKVLYKNITQFYRERGSVESIKVFFRLLLNDEVEVSYPGDQMLIPSSGDWDPDAASRVPVFDDEGNITEYVVGTGRYLDRKGQLSNDKIRIQDSNFYQKFSYLIRTGSNLDLWGNAFNKLIHPAGFKFFGEIVLFINLIRERGVPRSDEFRWTNSIMPLLQPGLIGAEDVALLFEFFARLTNPNFKVNVNRSAQVGTVKVSGGVIEYVEITDRGFGYTVAPTIDITDEDGSSVDFTLELDDNGSIKTTAKTSDGISYVVPTDGGSGYTSPSAAITANSSAGELIDVDIINHGYKYHVTPTVEISAPDLPDGVQATAEVILDSNKRISGINITNAGSGYILEPKITIDGKINRLSEFLPIIVMELKEQNAGGRLQTYRSWKNLLHFYDNTPMYTFEHLTFEGMELETQTIYTNVGTEIYAYDSDVTAKLQQPRL